MSRTPPTVRPETTRRRRRRTPRRRRRVRRRAGGRPARRPARVGGLARPGLRRRGPGHGRRSGLLHAVAGSTRRARLLEVLVLSPMAVRPRPPARRHRHPARRRRRCGRCSDRPEPLVFLEGDPGFYSRVGFVAGGELGFTAPSVRIPAPRLPGGDPARLRPGRDDAVPWSTPTCSGGTTAWGCVPRSDAARVPYIRNRARRDRRGDPWPGPAAGQHPVAVVGARPARAAGGGDPAVHRRPGLLRPDGLPRQLGPHRSGQPDRLVLLHDRDAEHDRLRRHRAVHRPGAAGQRVRRDPAADRASWSC